MATVNVDLSRNRTDRRNVTPLDRALIAWGGVAAQALLAIAASVPLAVFGHVPVLEVLVVINLSIAAFNLLLEVRNKLVDAWEKLSRSSV